MFLLKLVIGTIAIVSASAFYMYIGYLISEERTKHKINELNNTISNLNECIDFLKTELVCERRSKINVTVNDTKEDDIYEN
jgi:hypothetical protein